ncbi:MAG: Tad domain-containing protein [Lachnospiraceae bacterium]|nr:Tad domain-containing protein [Lachnospiraceae bacterium]
MMKLFQKQNGVISIFLAIVLVPMLLVSAVFVDSSRLQLAKSMAASAGDLTMNAALANYDSVLKNLYGLFATSQNMDDIMDNLKSYYKNSMIAGGVEEAAADDYVQKIINWLSNKPESGLDDIMKISLSDDDIKLTGRTDASLMNPVMLKSQIVEFMKYRAPIDLASSLLEAFRSFKDVDKQTESIKKKSDYLEQQNTLFGHLETAWKNICYYQYNTADELADKKVTDASGQQHAFPEDKYFKTVFNRIETAQNSIVAGNTSLSEQMQKSGLLTMFSAARYSQFGFEEGRLILEYKNDSWETKRNEFNNANIRTRFSENNKASVQDILDCMNDCENKLRDIRQDEEIKKNREYFSAAFKRTDLDTAARIALVMYFNGGGSDENLASFEDKIVYNGLPYTKAVSEFYTSLLSLEEALEHHEDKAEETTISRNGNDDGWKKDGSDTDQLLEVVEEQYIEKHLKDEDAKVFKDYKEITDAILRISNDPAAQAKRDKAYGIELELGYLLDGTTNMNALLEARLIFLDTARQSLNAAEGMMGDQGSYGKALGEWEQKNKEIDETELGKNQTIEIEQFKKLIRLEDVRELRIRIDNLYTLIKDMRDNVQKYSLNTHPYYSQKQESIASNWTQGRFIHMLRDGAVQSGSGKDPLTRLIEMNVQAESDYYEVAREVLNKSEYGHLPNWEPAASPDLTSTPMPLYDWLLGTFGIKLYAENDKRESDGTSGKQEAKEAGKTITDKMGEDEVKKDPKESQNGSTVTAVKRQFPDHSSLPTVKWYEALSDGSAGGTLSLNGFDISNSDPADGDSMLNNASNPETGLGSILGVIQNVTEDMRDNFYLTDYIMRMFSYNSMEAEKTFKADKKTISGEWWISDGSNDQGGVYKPNDKYKTIIADSVSLTRNEISPNNNYLYGKEVEYIIYGDENSVAAAYGTIYLIRFGLNLIYAFTDSEIQQISSAFASAVAVIPILVPIVKLAVIIALALAESAWDIYKMSTGRPVPLWKNSKTWVMKPSGVARTAIGEVANRVVDTTFENVSKGLEDIVSMTDQELQNLINQGGDSLKNLADSMVENTVASAKNAAHEALSKALEFCEYERARLTVQAKTEEVVQAVNYSLQTWLKSQESLESSNRLYQVKKTAVDYLTRGSDSAVKQLVDILSNNSGDDLQDKLDNKIKELKEILIGQVNTVIDTGTDAVSRMKTEALNELKSAAQEGVEGVKNKVKDFVSEKIGKGGSLATSSDSVVSSLLNWGYSDYLTLFLFIAIVTSEETVLLRTADVITMNMRLLNGQYVVEDKINEDSIWYKLFRIGKRQKVLTTQDGAFSLANAYTYVNLEAKVEVKPWLLALHILSETTEKLNESKWYVFPYSGILGY